MSNGFWLLFIVAVVAAGVMLRELWIAPRRWGREITTGAFVVLVLAVAVMGLWPLPSAANAVPDAAKQYRRLLVRTAHAHVGLDAPIATYAAQIHQESWWNPRAKSYMGAAGLAQFMPATAEWMGDIDKGLVGADVYSPSWALRAMVVYDAWLLARVTGATPCDEWAMVLSSYNGGLGWVYKDQALASAKGVDKRVWFNALEQVNAGRSAGNFSENRGYVRNIITRWQPHYVAAGWGQGVCPGGVP